MNEERVFKGMTGDLVLDDRGARIVRRSKGAISQLTLRGEKFLPYDSIVAVQYRKANLAGSGYLQLSLRGGSEAKTGLLEATMDENTILWSNLPGRAGKKNREFAEARDLILERIARREEATKTCPECAETVKAAANLCRHCGYRFDAA